MVKYTWLLFFLFQNWVSQAQGIDFFHGSWQEAVELAKQEHKLIFLDAFASWCGPCKMMAKDVFSQKEVGDFYNENFINLKIDMEVGEGLKLRDKFNVNVYPTLLFIDPEKQEVVSSAVGAQAAPAFIQLGGKALGGNMNTAEWQELYENGNKTPKVLKNYAYALLQGNQEYLKIANEYINSQKDTLSKDNLIFIYDFANESDSRIFSLLLKHKEAILKHKSIKDFENKIEKACNNTVKKAVEFKSLDLLKEAKANMEQANKPYAKIYQISADMQYYKGLNDWENYLKSADVFISKYGKSNIPKADAIVSYIGQSKNAENEKTYKKMLNWLDLLVEWQPNYKHFYQKAFILSKLNRKKEALKIAEKAQEQASQENIEPQEIKNLIQELKK